MKGDRVSATDPTNYVWPALERFARYGDAEALIYEGRRLTYADLITGVHTMATALRSHGIAAGDAVAILAGVPPESVFIHLALHMLGCRSVWIAPSAPTSQQVSFLRRAQAKAFVYDPATHTAMGAPLVAAEPEIPVFCFGPGGIGPDLTDVPTARTAPIAPGEVHQEPDSLFQTGGTTGQPKLVHHRHSYFLALQAISDYYLASGGGLLHHLTLAGYWHASTQTAAMMTLLTGGKFVMHHGISTEDFLTQVRDERITSTLLPPPLLYQLIDHPGLATADLSSLTMLSVGGSAAAPARLAHAINRLGPVLRPVYGMSEATFITAYPGLAHDPAHPERLASAGTAYGDMKIEIRDVDRKPLPPGETGEIWVTGSMVMSGYWDEPDLTAETLVDGWLRTGDVGRLDDDGYLFIVDRVKDMIVTGQGSTNVYSRPVEDALLSHPQVRAAAVVGVPHPEFGEAVHAYVELAPAATVTAEDLRHHVVTHLSPLWAPQRVDIIDTWPLTEMGKVDKKALRARYLADHPQPDKGGAVGSTRPAP